MKYINGKVFMNSQFNCSPAIKKPEYKPRNEIAQRYMAAGPRPIIEIDRRRFHDHIK